jgi:DNA-binding transcriptional regulator YiaG
MTSSLLRYQADRVQHGTSLRGRSLKPILTPDLVRQIRTSRDVTAQEWSRRLGVTQATVRQARNGRTWRDVA